MTPPPSTQVPTMPSPSASPSARRQAFPHAGYQWRGVVNHGHLPSALGGLAVLVLAVLLVPRFVPVSQAFILGMACGFAAFLLWWMQVESLLQQNRPMLARLVPGHVAAHRAQSDESQLHPCSPCSPVSAGALTDRCPRPPAVGRSCG